MNPLRPPSTSVVFAGLVTLLYATPPSPCQAGATVFRFAFGSGPPPAGYTQVLPTATYSGERGYGFDLGSAGQRPFFFSVAVPEGNYRVTVTLGDGVGESATVVKAESRRLMLEEVRTAAGCFETRTFTVNVRNPRLPSGGQVRLSDREKGALHWDDKLTLEFGGTRPALARLEIAQVYDAVTLFLAGDSTVTDQMREPWAAWGQMRPRFFAPEVAVANHAERIVTEMTRRFGGNPAVWGWQIDNEISHYGRGYSYAEANRDKFRAWLKARYGDVRRLNEAWGNAFRSQNYGDFAQIDIPNPDELVAAVNEHALLDFQRWFAEEAADYIRFQAELLRRNTKDQWVTTNFMHLHKEVYPPLSGEDLDIVTWTLYPVHGDLNQGPLGFRLGDGTAISFMGDFARAINGRHGLMELQPGQVNWGQVNPQPYPGAVRNWILRAFALGAKLLCTYRYREPLFGNEQFHAGIVGTDGVTLSRGGQEWVQAMRELRILRANRPADPKEPPRYAARRAAILYNVDNRFDLDNHPQTLRWDTMGHVLKNQRALKGLGAPVDVITEDKDFTRYPFLVAPAYQLVDEALVARWKTYVEGGGHLVLSARTGIKDRRGHLWEGPWAAPIRGLIGADVTLYDVLPPPHLGHVKSALSAKSHEWGAWAEVIKPRPEAVVLAGHDDQFYAGEATAVRRKLEKGSVTYVGVETLSGDLEKEIVRRVFTDAGVPIEDYPDLLFVDWHEGFWIASNFSSTVQPAPLPPGATPLVGTRELAPAGVAIWKD